MKHKLAPETFTNLDIFRKDLREGIVEHIGYDSRGVPIYQQVNECKRTLL
jgi:hypothetical protein